MKKIDAILYILRSRNFILIHSIKEREVLGVVHKNVKVVRNTSYDEEGDKAAMRNAYYKCFKEVE